MQRENPVHRAIVEEGGGVYVPGMMVDLVLFNSPETRSTLALKENQLTSAAVRDTIRQSNLSFGK